MLDNVATDAVPPVENPPMICRRMTVGSLTVDLDASVAMRAGRILKLWPKEFALLVYLVEHANEIVSRSAIAKNVWGDTTAMWTNVIAVNINGLRKEIEREGLPTLLHTVRGRGYMLSEPAGRE